MPSPSSITAAVADAIPVSPEGTARLAARLTVAEIYPRLPHHTLPVEPLGTRESLEVFLRAGGLGWGASRSNGLGASVCRLVTEQFEYGSERMTLYNVGYPLHRFVEWGGGGAGAELLNGLQFGRIQELTLRLEPKPQERPRAWFSEMPVGELRFPFGARDAVYLNPPAAALFELPGPGILAFMPPKRHPGQSGELREPRELNGNLWEKRFFADRLPDNQPLLRLHALRRHLPRLLELTPAGGVFVALATHLGFLVAVAGNEGELARLSEAARELPLARVLG